MEPKKTEHELPLGFGMALAQNPNAMERFVQMTDEEKETILSGVKNVRSKQEMRMYVENSLLK